MADEVALASALQPPTITKSILFGNSAVPLSTRNGNNTHSWKIYVRSPCGEDLAFFIKKVTFTLHSSFKNANRVIEHPPFEVEEQGWGEFDIQIKIHFHDPIFKPIQFKHFLKLFVSEDTVSLSNGGIVREIYEELEFPPVDPPSEELGMSSQLIPEFKTESGIDYFRIEQAALVKIEETLTRVKDSLRYIRTRHGQAEAETKAARADILQLEHGSVPERFAKKPKPEPEGDRV